MIYKIIFALVCLLFIIFALSLTYYLGYLVGKRRNIENYIAENEYFMLYNEIKTVIEKFEQGEYEQ